MTRLGLISTLVLAVGCGDDAPMDPESSTGMETSSGSTSTPSTSSSTTEDASSSSSGEETTEESGSSTTTTTTTTTGEPSTESSGSSGGSATLEEACTAYCTTLRMCEGHKGIEMCVQPCVSADASSGAECIDAAIAFYDCLAALSCEDPFSTCDAEATAHYQACTETCSVAITRGEECGADFACPDNDYEITCDETTCTCWENGAAVGECDANGICDVGDVSEYASECCDFAFD